MDILNTHHHDKPDHSAEFEGGRSGRECALVVRVSDYPPTIRKRPGVANDASEMAGLLSSDQGQFPSQNVRCLADGEPTQKAVLEAVESTSPARKKHRPVISRGKSPKLANSCLPALLIRPPAH